MEIMMKNIRMCRQKGHALSQITLEEDVNVPDSRPDVMEIIQYSGKMHMEESKVMENQSAVNGYMEADILCLAEGESRQIYRLQVKLPFQEKLNLEGVMSGDTVSLKWEIEDMKVQLINSRKISIMALVEFEATAEELYDTRAAVEVQGVRDLCVKKKEIMPLSLAVQKKDILRIKEDIVLPSNKPDIGEILWENIMLRGTDIRISDENIEVKSELCVFVLYRTDDANETKQWFETMVPIHGSIACAECRQDAISDIAVSLSESGLEVRPDYDGEERILQTDAVLELDIRLYEEERVSIIEDVYSPAAELIPDFKEKTYESLLVKNESKCKAVGKIRISDTRPRLLQICYCTGTVKIDHMEALEQGIQMEGAVDISVLYITADDSRPFALAEGVIPFSHLMEVKGLTKDSSFHVQPELEQLTPLMIDSEEMEVKCGINLNMLAVENHRQQCIDTIEEHPANLKKIQEMPGIVGYVVQPKDTLWDIARRWCTTPERIKEINGLEGEEIKAGSRLLIIKNLLA